MGVVRKASNCDNGGAGIGKVVVRGFFSDYVKSNRKFRLNSGLFEAEFYILSVYSHL